MKTKQRPTTNKEHSALQSSGSPQCLVCDRISKTVFLEKDGHTYYYCPGCQGIYVWPVQPQQFYLDTDTYLKDVSAYTNMIDLQGQRWIIEQFERLYREKSGSDARGSFLEVGAGTGFLTLFALARGWDARGIETSPEAVKVARDHMRLEVNESTLEAYKDSRHYDAIAMIEVLEHFINPLHAIDHLRRFAKGRTVLFGTTPNTDSDHWHTGEQDIYQPNDHIFLFNKRSIERFAEKAGIRNFSVEYFGGGAAHDSNLMYAGVIERDA